MAAGTTIQHKRKAGVFTGGQLAAGEFGVDTTNGVVYFSTNGSTVTTTLPDDAVTLAKMAGGTAGNLITYDASGNPAAVETGIVGRALVSGGEGVAPTFQVVLPAGLVSPYAGTAAPSGWLLCAGQNVSRTTYAALFTAISTTYGVGDGSTTFALPDLRGRVVAGKDDMGGSAAGLLTNSGTGNPGISGVTLGASGGVDRHTLTTAEMPAHTHSSPTSDGASNSATGSANRAANDNGTTGSTGSSQAHPNVQPTLVLNYIIKT